MGSIKTCHACTYHARPRAKEHHEKREARDRHLGDELCRGHEAVLIGGWVAVRIGHGDEGVVAKERGVGKEHGGDQQALLHSVEERDCDEDEVECEGHGDEPRAQRAVGEVSVEAGYPRHRSGKEDEGEGRVSPTPSRESAGAVARELQRQPGIVGGDLWR